MFLVVQFVIAHQIQRSLANFLLRGQFSSSGADLEGLLVELWRLSETLEDLEDISPSKSSKYAGAPFKFIKSFWSTGIRGWLWGWRLGQSCIPSWPFRNFWNLNFHRVWWSSVQCRRVRTNCHPIAYVAGRVVLRILYVVVAGQAWAKLGTLCVSLLSDNHVMIWSPVWPKWIAQTFDVPDVFCCNLVVGATLDGTVCRNLWDS